MTRKILKRINTVEGWDVIYLVSMAASGFCFSIYLALRG